MKICSNSAIGSMLPLAALASCELNILFLPNSTPLFVPYRRTYEMAHLHA